MGIKKRREKRQKQQKRKVKRTDKIAKLSTEFNVRAPPKRRNRWGWALNECECSNTRRQQGTNTSAMPTYTSTPAHTHTAHRHGLTAAKSEALTQIRKPEHMISLVKRAIGGHQQHFKGGGVERWEKRLVRGGEDR